MVEFEEEKQNIQQNKNKQLEVEIDGLKFEGGGQIIRNSMAMSNLLRQPFIIKNIRANRPNPGLNNQLLSQVFINSFIINCCINQDMFNSDLKYRQNYKNKKKLKLMRQISKADVIGDKISSQNLKYIPKGISGGKYSENSHSASSISLMFQSLLPTLLFADQDSQLQLCGGTTVGMSPSASSIVRILKPLLQLMGVQFTYEQQRHGYYPSGGGAIESSIQQMKGCLKPLDITIKSNISSGYIEIIHVDPGLKAKDVIKPIKHGIQKLIKRYNMEHSIAQNVDDIVFETQMTLTDKKRASKSTNIYAAIVHLFGENNWYDCSVIIDKNDNQSTDYVVDTILQKFDMNFTQGGCMDSHTQDQAILLMGLAKGKSRIRVGNEITLHSQAAFYILKQFIPDIQIQIDYDKLTDSNIIEITGIGYECKF